MDERRKTEVLRHTAHREMPWRNGGGSTLEVARRPREGDLDDFDWRVSFARVSADGAFSPFPGVDRVITLVEGEEMRLRLRPDPALADVGEVADVVDLERHVPFAFAGERPVECRVAGSTTDLNVMTRRGRVGATVTVHRLGDELTLLAGDRDHHVLVAVLEGRPTIAEEAPIGLDPLDVVELGPEGVPLTGPGVVAVIDLVVSGAPTG